MHCTRYLNWFEFLKSAINEIEALLGYFSSCSPLVALLPSVTAFRKCDFCTHSGTFFNSTSSQKWPSWRSPVFSLSLKPTVHITLVSPYIWLSFRHLTMRTAPPLKNLPVLLIQWNHLSTTMEGLRFLPYFQASELGCQFHKRWQKMWVSWVRDKGLYYSPHSREQELPLCKFPLSPPPSTRRMMWGWI